MDRRSPSTEGPGLRHGTNPYRTMSALGRLRLVRVMVKKWAQQPSDEGSGKFRRKNEIHSLVTAEGMIRLSSELKKVQLAQTIRGIRSMTWVTASLKTQLRPKRKTQLCTLVEGLHTSKKAQGVLCGKGRARSRSCLAKHIIWMGHKNSFHSWTARFWH